MVAEVEVAAAMARVVEVAGVQAVVVVGEARALAAMVRVVAAGVVEGRARFEKAPRALLST